MSSAFVGRDRELAIIDRIWKSNKAALIILYGRRRVGKTRLLTHWMRRHPTDGFYWMAEATSALDQLRSFSQMLANFADPEAVAPLDFTYANWEQALRQLSLISREKRIAVFIDEVTYLMDVTPDFISTLQKAWDHWFTESNVMLTLSGLQMKELLSYDAPLYGRATAQINLSPLPFGVTSNYFPNYAAADRVSIYAIWGGIPAYWERLDPDLPVIDNLRLQLEPANTWMLDESKLLLQDFLTDFYNYVGIMRAMAQGQETLNDLSARAGLSGGPASKYLSILRDTGFVERRVPVTERSVDSRRGRYFVIDPYLRFYYRYLAAYQSKLAMGQQRQMLEYIKQNLPAFVSANTWQELCREWLIMASAQDDLPLPIEYVGSEWRRNFTIDVVGISEVEHSLILGCCLWNTEPADAEPLYELVRHTSSMISTDEVDWSVYYVGFAAGGWRAEVQQEVEASLSDEQASRACHKWQPCGVRLVNLATLDADLARWLKQG